jgi:RND family efflux transporter MFP subunit
MLCVVLALGACKDGGESGAGGDGSADTTASGSTLSLPVVGDVVRQGDLVLSVTTTGQISSEAVVTLRAETQGTVQEIAGRAGDRVRRGDPIVRLDPQPFDLTVQEAEAAHQKAELVVRDYALQESTVTGRAPAADRLRNQQIRAGLDEARARLERARLDRERAVITAPFDGILDHLRIAPGERVSAGQEIGKVVDLEHLRIDAAVLEHDLPLIRVGGEAVVLAAASPDRPVHGRIATLLPLVDSATRAGRALIRVRGNGMLRPGMYADVRLEANRLPNRIIVPYAAVIERDGRPLVFVVRGGRAQWVYIQPGRNNGFEYEVLPDSSTGEIPVQPGDTVLVEGHLTLTHDAPVRVVPRAERARPQ